MHAALTGVAWGIRSFRLCKKPELCWDHEALSVAKPGTRPYIFLDAVLARYRFVKVLQNERSAYRPLYLWINCFFGRDVEPMCCFLSSTLHDKQTLLSIIDVCACLCVWKASLGLCFVCVTFCVYLLCLCFSCFSFWTLGFDPILYFQLSFVCL